MLSTSKLLQSLVKFDLRQLHTSCVCCKSQAGKHKFVKNRKKNLTYEQVQRPWHISERKSWLSWNTANLLDAPRASETAVEDVFIRKFMHGTWPTFILSELVIKRRYNIVVIAGIIKRFNTQKCYFLLGYTEEMLSYLLKCNVKLELQTARFDDDVVFKRI